MKALFPQFPFRLGNTALRVLLPEGLPLEVDGGIDADSAPRCRAAGATLFVAGSAVFGTPDPGKAYQEIADAIGG